jgi:hypothetical protein
LELLAYLAETVEDIVLDEFFESVFVVGEISEQPGYFIQDDDSLCVAIEGIRPKCWKMMLLGAFLDVEEQVIKHLEHKAYVLLGE